jgi:HEPN domain-containing protein
MPDTDHVNQLLEIARRDLRAAEAMLDATVFPDEIFGFQGQQAVEKCLKAWLTLLEIDYPRIHDLDELFLMLIEAGAEVSPEWRSLSDLTPFAVQFRYDTLDIAQTSLDRGDIVDRIRQLVDHVASLANLA